MQPESGRPRLRRELGLIDATAIGLGAIIGAGVFVAIGPAVDVAGPAALASLVVAGFVALLNALSSAQLAAAYPVSGGTYAYGREVISNAAGFIAGWVFIISAVSADSAIALTFGAYLDFLFPGLSARWLAAALALIMTAINYLGIRYSAGANTVLVVLKVGALLAFIGIGLPNISTDRLVPFLSGGMSGVLGGAAILFFAYTGYARIATLGEEVRDPARTIPRAILSALGLSALLYMGTLLVALGLVGAEPLASSQTPLSAAMQASGLRIGVYIISIGALVATFSVFLTDLLGISRVVFAMARNSDLPAGLSAVHPTFHTPHNAVLVSGLSVAVLAAFLPLRSLVEASSFGLLVYYGLTNLAALRLSEEKRRYHRVWAAAGLVACLALAFFLPRRIIGLEAMVIAAGVAYFLGRRHLGRGSTPRR